MSMKQLPNPRSQPFFFTINLVQLASEARNCITVMRKHSVRCNGCWFIRCINESVMGDINITDINLSVMGADLSDLLMNLEIPALSNLSITHCYRITTESFSDGSLSLLGRTDHSSFCFFLSILLPATPYYARHRFYYLFRRVGMMPFPSLIPRAWHIQKT